jgi:hypothetical protein
LEAQFGGQVTPLGFDRLKVVEWLHALIQLRDPAICKKIVELEFPQLLLKMMTIHDMNSFLHLRIFNVFNEAITGAADDYVRAVFLPSFGRIMESPPIVRCDMQIGFGDSQAVE